MNFDNVGRSMINLFILSTLEGWPEYTRTFVEATYDGPRRNHINILPLVIIILFIFIGSMFLLNLFTGVLFLNYKLAESAAKDSFMSSD